MSRIKIMCTSTGCIDYAPERYRSLEIDIIRIHVFFNGKEYREGFDLDLGWLFKPAFRQRKRAFSSISGRSSSICGLRKCGSKPLC